MDLLESALSCSLVAVLFGAGVTATPPARPVTPNAGRGEVAVGPFGPRVRGAPDPRIPPVVGATALVLGPPHRVGWVDVYELPDRTSRRVAQALLGEELRVVDADPGQSWSRIQERCHGSFEGWVETNALTAGGTFVRDAWRQRQKAMVVKAPTALETDGLVIPFGTVLPVADPDRRGLLLPDGREVTLGDGDTVEAGLALPRALEAIRAFVRVPAYGDGGNTVEAMDDAGLVYLFYRSMGMAIPRSRELLQRVGEAVAAADAREGDIAFIESYEALPRPVLAIDGATAFLEAFAGSNGVNYLWREQAERRGIRFYRRLAAAPAATPFWAPGPSEEANGGYPRSAFLPLIATLHAAMLLILVFASCRRGGRSGSRPAVRPPGLPIPRIRLRIRRRPIAHP